MVGSVSFPKIFDGHSLQSLLFMGHGDCRSCELNRKYSCALLVVHRGEKLMRRLQWCRGSWCRGSSCSGPNGTTTRLIDIEEDYMAQKQRELDELHERM